MKITEIDRQRAGETREALERLAQCHPMTANILREIEEVRWELDALDADDDPALMLRMVAKCVKKLDRIVDRFDGADPPSELESLLFNDVVEAFKDAEVPRCSATMNSSPSPKS